MFGKRARRCPRTRRRTSTRAVPTRWPSSTATGSPSTTARATTSSRSRASSSTTSRRGADASSSRARSPSTVARIKLGSARRALTLGNVEAKRDWGYAKEYVEAMWLMLQRRRSPATTWSERAAPALGAECYEIAFDHVGTGLSRALRAKSTRASCVPQRSIRCWPTRVKAARAISDWTGAHDFRRADPRSWSMPRSRRLKRSSGRRPGGPGTR